MQLYRLLRIKEKKNKKETQSTLLILFTSSNNGLQNPKNLEMRRVTNISDDSLCLGWVLRDFLKLASFIDPFLSHIDILRYLVESFESYQNRLILWTMLIVGPKVSLEGGGVNRLSSPAEARLLDGFGFIYGWLCGSVDGENDSNNVSDVRLN